MLLDLWRSVVGVAPAADVEYLCFSIFICLCLAFVFKGFYILLNKF